MRKNNNYENMYSIKNKQGQIDNAILSTLQKYVHPIDVTHS